MRFEPLAQPYERYSVTDTGHVLDVDTNKYVAEELDKKTKRTYVILRGSHNKSRKFYVANLVAEMFVKNTYNLGFIYFKDGNSQNNHYENLNWAINPKESTQRVDRPHRKRVESKRHELIVKINNACAINDYTNARKYGIELWELEGSSWEDRFDEV